MNNKTFDVLIVGAGPAGSFAAERLAHSGVRVALFDGRPASEPKACGGGVTSKALKQWPHLLEAMCRTIDKVDMYAPSGQHTSVRLTEPFAIYSRRAFDTHLRERAQAAGAQVFAERISIEFEKDKDELWMARSKKTGEWCGKFLVAADGANSSIARRLAGALPPSEMEVAFGYRAPLPKRDKASTIVAFLPNWAGYAWAFPHVDHVSFGIATAQDAFDHHALDHLLWEFMIGYYLVQGDEAISLWPSASEQQTNPRYTEIKNRLSERTERYAARIPGLAAETWNKRQTAGKDWALLGDAAGFADPVTGEGIYYALRSAELFAEAYLEDGAVTYEEKWRADFGRELRRAAEMRRRFYGTFWGAPFTERMIQFARRHRGVRRVLGELIAGDQGYFDLKGVLMRRAIWPR